MSDPINVFVVEQGEYSDRGIVGVYDSPEAAMLDHPGNWKEHRDAVNKSYWSNGENWDSAKCITRYEVQTLKKLTL